MANKTSQQENLLGFEPALLKQDLLKTVIISVVLIVALVGLSIYL
jgi:hypothetical protein